jgi:hypothetical protein
MTARGATAWLLLVLAVSPRHVAAELAPAPSQPLGGPPRCFRQEHWDLDILLLGVTAGRARVDIPRGCDGADPVTVNAAVRTTSVVRWLWRVNDTLETTLDGRTGATVSSALVDDENGTREERLDRYVAGAVETRWRLPSGERDTRVAAPAGTRDPLAVLLQLRGQPLVTGSTFTVPIFSRDAVYDGTVAVMERVPVEGPSGPRRCVRLRATFIREGRPSRVHADIFLTDDEERLPLKVVAGTRYGHLTALLRAATRAPQASAPSALDGG